MASSCFLGNGLEGLNGLLFLGGSLLSSSARAPCAEEWRGNARAQNPSPPRPATSPPGARHTCSQLQSFNSDDASLPTTPPPPSTTTHYFSAHARSSGPPMAKFGPPSACAQAQPSVLPFLLPQSSQPFGAGVDPPPNTTAPPRPPKPSFSPPSARVQVLTFRPPVFLSVLAAVACRRRPSVPPVFLSVFPPIRLPPLPNRPQRWGAGATFSPPKRASWSSQRWGAGATFSPPERASRPRPALGAQARPSVRPPPSPVLPIAWGAGATFGPPSAGAQARPPSPPSRSGPPSEVGGVGGLRACAAPSNLEHAEEAT
ncbi:uncharacterized protein [Heterodontus francisci]|uniref:uncharacterized protein n=1 Tax=Heterodontus francisci TaxID=7792 RepID=UPI00355B56B3